MDNSDPSAFCIANRVKLLLGGVDTQTATVSAVRIDTAENLNQRRFASTVFATERVDFTGTHLKRSIV